MEINKSNIFEIVNKADLKPDKDYGQNFLVESQICERIVDALNLEEKDIVIEVGPGLGSLTHFLSMKKCNVSAIDIDRRMIDFLSVVYKDTNVKIIENDIRKVDVSNYTKIVGNLPYNITTETIQYSFSKSGLNKIEFWGSYINGEKVYLCDYAFVKKKSISSHQDYSDSKIKLIET